MWYSSSFIQKNINFLDFQAKIKLGVVIKNYLELNNSQLQLESVSVQE